MFGGIKKHTYQRCYDNGLLALKKYQALAVKGFLCDCGQQDRGNKENKQRQPTVSP
jgi:hypothetical protein